MWAINLQPFSLYKNSNKNHDVFFWFSALQHTVGNQVKWTCGKSMYNYCTTCSATMHTQLVKMFFNISLQQEQNTTQHNTAQHAGSLPAWTWQWSKGGTTKSQRQVQLATCNSTARWLAKTMPPKQTPRTSCQPTSSTLWQGRAGQLAKRQTHRPTDRPTDCHGRSNYYYDYSYYYDYDFGYNYGHNYDYTSLLHFFYFFPAFISVAFASKPSITI